MIAHILRTAILLLGLLLAIVPYTFGQTTEVLLYADSVVCLPGAEISLPVRVQGFEKVVTAQGTVTFDSKAVAFLGIEQFGLPDLSSANFNSENATNGDLMFSWDDPALIGQSLPDDAILFTIRFKVLGEYGSSSEISFINKPTKLEFSNNTLEEVVLTTRSGVIDVSGYAIKTHSLANDAYCAGSSFTVNFTAQGDYATDNIFIAELSDSNGDFNDPVIIGSSERSPVQVTLPSDISEGSKYRIWVKAADPLVVGSDNGEDISIMPVPLAPTVTGGNSCGPGVLTLYAGGAPEGGVFRWYTDANSSYPLSESKEESFTTGETQSTTTYYVSVVNSMGCESERVPVEAHIYDLDLITAGSDEAYCITDKPFIPSDAWPVGGTWSGAGVNDAGLFDPSVVGAGVYTIKYIYNCSNGSIGEATKKVRVIDLESQPKIKRTRANTLVVDLIGTNYNWEINGKPFTTQTNQIKITEPGFYKVTVTDGACASASSEVTPVSLYSDFVAYPNPSFGTVKLSGPVLNETLEVEIYNTIGKRVFSKSLVSFTGQESLDLNQLSPDMYYILVKTTNFRKIIRLAVAI